MHLHVRNVNEAFAKIVGGFHDGSIKAGKTTSRNGVVMVYEEPFTLTYEKPLERVLFNRARDANIFFHLYESLWLLAGRNDVDSLSYYNSKIHQFSDDGQTFNGAYGYRWRHHTHHDIEDNPENDTLNIRTDQLDVLVDHLHRHLESRRAVLTMWTVENDLLKVDTSHDVCCNLTAMFQVRGGGPCEECNIRNQRLYFTDPGPCPVCGTSYNQVGRLPGSLDITVCNRSNDLVWGMLGANVVQFSFLLEYMAARLGCVVGKYHHFTNNLHAYEWNWKPDLWLSDQTPDYYTNPSVETAQDWGVDFSHHLPLVEDPECFESECSRIVQLHANGDSFGTYSEVDLWKEPFLQTVAEPMFRAYHAYKFKDYDSALRWANLVAAPDWRIAARGWIQRRLERRAAARPGGGG